MTNEQIRDFLEKHAEKQFKRFYQQPDSGDRFDSGSAVSKLRSLAKQFRKGRLENLSQVRHVMTPHEEIMLQDL